MTESWRRRTLVNLTLETAQHYVLDTLPLRRLQFISLTESHRIQYLQETCERSRVAVMRRGTEEQSVFELGSN